MTTPMLPERRYKHMARKILVTVVVGALVYFFTELALSDAAWSIMASIVIGGVAFLAQYLMDVEDRLCAAVESNLEYAEKTKMLIDQRFTEINDGTELLGLMQQSAVPSDMLSKFVHNATKLNADAPAIARAFAQGEIRRLSDLLAEIATAGEVTYEGEDRDWLLGLTANATRLIRTTSLTAVDGSMDNGLWKTDLGQRYLEKEHEAVNRGVAIQRIFVADRQDLLDDVGFLRQCQAHAELGIDVRMVGPQQMDTLGTAIFDVVLFDEVISYETTPNPRMEGAHAAPMLTVRLVMRPERVRQQLNRFQALWDAAKTPPTTF